MHGFWINRGKKKENIVTEVSFRCYSIQRITGHRVMKVTEQTRELFCFPFSVLFLSFTAIKIYSTKPPKFRANP